MNTNRPNELDDFRKRLDRVADSLQYEVVTREEGIVMSVGDGVARVQGLANVR